MAHSKDDGTGPRRPHAASEGSDSSASSASSTLPTNRNTTSPPPSRAQHPSVSQLPGTPSPEPAGAHHQTGSAGSGTPPMPPPAPRIAARHRPMTPETRHYYESPTMTPPKHTKSSDSSPSSGLSSGRSSVHVSHSGSRVPDAARTAGLGSPMISVQDRYIRGHRYTGSDSSGKTHLTTADAGSPAAGPAAFNHASPAAGPAASLRSNLSVTSLNLDSSPGPGRPIPGSPRQHMLAASLSHMQIHDVTEMALDPQNGRNHSPYRDHGRHLHPGIDRIMSGDEGGSESEEARNARIKNGKRAVKSEDDNGEQDKRGGSNRKGRDHGNGDGEDGSGNEAGKRPKGKGKKKDDHDEHHKRDGDNQRRDHGGGSGGGSGSGGDAAGNANTQWHPYAGPSNQRKR